MKFEIWNEIKYEIKYEVKYEIWYKIHEWKTVMSIIINER